LIANEEPREKHAKKRGEGRLDRGLSGGNIEFPCELFALANSLEAETLLQGFNFFKVQNAKAMPGNLPFWSEDGYEGGARVTASSQRGGFGPPIKKNVLPRRKRYSG